MQEDLFASLAETNPDIETEEDDEEDIGYVPPSASQQESSSPNDSDLQTGLKILNPVFSEKELQDIAPIIMQGRIFPDNFFAKVHLLTMASIKKNRHNKDFNYLFTYMKYEGMCQIGYLGKNRVETLIALGNTKEQAEQESGKSGY